ncbi:MAG: hypothetical protein U1D69_01070 [Polynucleobacter sp.]|nr:hypothetical protein [Polynucleobacter sp.]
MRNTTLTARTLAVLPSSATGLLSSANVRAVQYEMMLAIPTSIEATSLAMACVIPRRTQGTSDLVTFRESPNAQDVMSRAQLAADTSAAQR